MVLNQGTRRECTAPTTEGVQFLVAQDVYLYDDQHMCGA